MRDRSPAAERLRKPQEFGRACDFAARMTVCAQYMRLYRVCRVAASKPIRAPGKGRGDRGTATQSRRGGVSAERRVFTRTWRDRTYLSGQQHRMAKPPVSPRSQQAI